MLRMPSQQQGGSSPILNDVSSLSSPLPDLVRQRAIAHLQDALRMIPADQKVAYIEALNRCPRLVDTESDPMKFLRCENFNAWNAARRLVTYWNMRSDVFGERAFLPLDLSGTGALNPEDIESVKVGTYALTSNELQRGCSVLCIDRGRDVASQEFSLGARLRRNFFFLDLMSRNPVSQVETEGFVIVFRARGTEQSYDVVRATRELILKALPIHLKSIHLPYVQQDKQTLIQHFAPLLAQQTGPLFANKLVVHNCGTVTEVVEKLSSHGISQDKLPQSFGGPWTFEIDHTRFLIQHGYPLLAMGCSNSSASVQLGDRSNLDLLANTADRGTQLYEKRTINTSEIITLPADFGLSIASQREGLLQVATLACNGADDLDVSIVRETPDVIERGLASLAEAMQYISDADKAAYIEAMTRSPELVQKESDPIRFLRFERFNAWAAAKRLATYWKNRVTIFKDRAFLPLIQTGGGALDDEDLQALKSGYFYLLPKDMCGRSVLCYDPSRRLHNSLGTRLRLMFYMVHLICQNEKTQTDGYVAIMVLGRPAIGGAYPFDGSARLIVDLSLDSFPGLPNLMHVVYCPPEKHSFFNNILPMALKAFGKIFNQRTQFHVGDSEDELVRKFESFGISKKSLPRAIGGEFTEAAVDQWLSNTHNEELKVYGQGDSEMARSVVSLPSAPIPVDPFQCDVQRVQNAMQMLPQSEIAACIEAMEKYPEIFQKESHPVRFLKFASYDTAIAAKLLALYWNTRREIFADRAFLPMDQTGDGALERKDVGVLQSGYLTQLPRDAEGRSVLCCDGTKLQKSSRLSRLRCTFYMWSIVCENELSQTDGYSVLYFITEPSFDRANKECLDMVVKAVPARLKFFHLVGCPPDNTSAEAFSEGPVKETVELLDGFIQERTVTHVGSSRSDLARKLGAYGLLKNGLPKSLAGNWGFQEFVQWQELRVRHEWGLSIGPGTRNAAEEFNIPINRTCPDLNESERNERKRRMNVIHSRRKRERERIEVEVLHEQCLELKDEKNRLKEEGERLASLVQLAESTVPSSVCSG